MPPELRCHQHHAGRRAVVEKTGLGGLSGFAFAPSHANSTTRPPRCYGYPSYCRTRVDSGRGQDRTLIGRQGEIRDRSSEGQHYRMAGLNLLAAIVIYWNTAHLGEAVRQRKHAGPTVEPELLTHILLTGEYRWPKRR